MNDLISREALLKKIFPYGMPDNGNYGINAKAVREAITRAEAVDAERIIRCKNCEYWYDGYCDNPNGLDVSAKPDAFCSCGKLKNK